MKKCIRIMLFSCIVFSAGSSVSAAASATEKALVTAKLLGAGLCAGGAAIAIDKLSPAISKPTILAFLGASTILSARLICRGDINTVQKSISLPIAGQYFAELNWFNAITFGVGLASFGLYKNSGKLAEVLNAIARAADGQ
jgi:hypothetical protein